MNVIASGAIHLVSLMDSTGVPAEAWWQVIPVLEAYVPPVILPF